MGKFSWVSTILHHGQTIEVKISGITEEENFVDGIELMRGLYGSVRVCTRDLASSDDHYHVVNTYREAKDLFNSYGSYIEHLQLAMDNYHGETIENVVLKNAYQKIYNDVFPTGCALYLIGEMVNPNGWAVSLENARDLHRKIEEMRSSPSPQPEESSNHSSSFEELLPSPLPSPPQSPLPDPIPTATQNQAQPTTSRVPPIPAPRKKIPTALVQPTVVPKVVSVISKTEPPPAYKDVVGPSHQNGMEVYYGRGTQAAPKAPTVEIIPSIRDLHLPVSTEPIVFRSRIHTAHPAPSVLDKVETMALDAASRIARKLRITKEW